MGWAEVGGADNLRGVRDIAHHAHFTSHHVVLRRCNVAHHVATRCITLRQVWQRSWKRNGGADGRVNECPTPTGHRLGRHACRTTHRIVMQRSTRRCSEAHDVAARHTPLQRSAPRCNAALHVTTRHTTLQRSRPLGCPTRRSQARSWPTACTRRPSGTCARHATPKAPILRRA